MSVWGPLAERYEGSEDRRHRLLAIDGGGIRGVVALEVLAELENQLRTASGAGSEFRLCDYFDYVAGTSTGAVVAAGIARGLSAQQLLEFYTEFGPRVFKFGLHKSLLNLISFLDDDAIETEIKNLIGEEATLEPENLRCLMLAVTNNRTTHSLWPISSNPMAQFNDLSLADCNLRIPLWRIVRASTAAPMVFPPEVIQWDPNDESKAFVFEDGGMTPHNSPAWLVYRMATLPEYRLNWAAGEDKLLVISVGTGSAPRVEDEVDDDPSALGSVLRVPGALIQGSMVEQDTNCRLVGRCVHGAPLDAELGDMIPRDENGAPLPLSEDQGRKFLYARYTADLSEEGLDAMGLSDIDSASVRKLNSHDKVDDLRRIGRKVADGVDLADYGMLAP